MDAHLSNLLTHSIAWSSCKSITLTGNTTYGFLYQCSHISAYKHQVCESGGELNNLSLEIKSKICSRLQPSKIVIFFWIKKILLAQNLSVIHFILHRLQLIHFIKHPSIHIQEDMRCSQASQVIHFSNMSWTPSSLRSLPSGTCPNYLSWLLLMGRRSSYIVFLSPS